MAFELLTRKKENSETLEKGQEWHGESVEKNLAFCEYEGLRHILQNYFSKDDMILEAGCGLGRWVLYFKSRGFKIIGCDINHQALKDAKNYDPSVCLVRADIRNLPFKDDIFDSVISLGVFEHFEDGPQRTMEESRRILKSKGLLFVAVPYNSLFRRILVNHFISLKIMILRALRHKVVFTEYRYSRPELNSFLGTSGFEVVSFYPEMLVPPKHIGAYIDYMHLTGIVLKNKFELPKPVRKIVAFIKSISPWLISGMVLCVARKNRRTALIQ